MMHNNSDHIIYCENLKKDYQDGDKVIPVLQDVSFSVRRGESVAIVGRSGSGKTTLLNLLGGLESPSSGKVVLDNAHLHALSDRKRGYLRNRVLGLIFQFHHLLPEFTALENVCMPLLIQGLPVSQVKERSRALLEKVGLGHRETHKPAALSGGERQRVAIARALVTEPSCVLADEPTGNLDSDTAATVFALVRQLGRDLGIAFVLVSHDLDLAAQCDRVLKLEAGVLNQVTLNA